MLISIHGCNPIGTMRLEILSVLLGPVSAMILLFAMFQTAECYRDFRRNSQGLAVSLITTVIAWALVLACGFFVFISFYAVNYCSNKL